jgi:hypothetical protein
MTMREGLRHCYDCSKDYIEEEWWRHPCVEAKRPVKDITIDFSYETTEEDGSRTIHAYGLNGNIYRLNLPTPDKLAELKEAESDESKQEDYSDWLRRRGNRTCFLALVISRRLPL